MQKNVHINSSLFKCTRMHQGLWTLRMQSLLETGNKKHLQKQLSTIPDIRLYSIEWQTHECCIVGLFLVFWSEAPFLVFKFYEGEKTTTIPIFSFCLSNSCLSSAVIGNWQVHLGHNPVDTFHGLPPFACVYFNARKVQIIVNFRNIMAVNVLLRLIGWLWEQDNKQ